MYHFVKTHALVPAASQTRRIAAFVIVIESPPCQSRNVANQLVTWSFGWGRSLRCVAVDHPLNAKLVGHHPECFRPVGLFERHDDRAVF